MNPLSWVKHKLDVRSAERECETLRRARIDDTARAQKEFSRAMEISPMLVERMEELAKGNTRQSGGIPAPKYSCTPYVPPFKNVVCSDLETKIVMASDRLVGGGANIYASGEGGLFTGMGFPGFPYLTELMQIDEYRSMAGRTAAEMCRKWAELKTKDGGKSRDKEIAAINAELTHLDVRTKFRRSAEKNYAFGRCQLFLDFGQTEGMELGLPILLNPYSIKRNSLRDLKIVEPITTYPAAYNSSWPLKSDYYVPSRWWVYGQEVHDTRMLTFVSHELPDLLKPIYNFSGMSMSQLAEPYVNYWLNTRDSVGRLLRNFSTSVLSTNMEGVLQGQNYENFLRRAQLYNALRDNQGLMLLDMNTEKFEKHETSLAGLDKLQAQAQEHMAAVAKTPLVILLGITPSGLNTSDEQGLRIYYDYIADQQEVLFRANLDKLIKVISLSLYGEIFDDITFTFPTLMSMTEKERALIHKSDAEEAQVLVTIGAVTNEEVRAKVSADPDSGWNNLNVNQPEGKLLNPANAQGKGATGKLGATENAENAQAEGAEFGGGNT